SLQKPARDRYGGPGGEREQHEVWRLDILKAHEVEAGVIEIRMNPLDRPLRSAGNPRDVRMRIAQQGPHRFPAHVATPTATPNTHHNVSPLLTADELCLLPRVGCQRSERHRG